MKGVLLASLLFHVAGTMAAVPLLGQKAKSAPKPPWVIENKNVVAIDPPEPIRAAIRWDGFNVPFVGVAADLNGDGRDDYIVKGGPDVCGNGGCLYLVINGATAKLIGTVTGNPIIIRAESTHGFPNIETYSHGGAESGAFTRYVFDGNKYVERSIQQLESRAVWTLFRTLNKLPRWPPASP